MRIFLVALCCAIGMVLLATAVGAWNLTQSSAQSTVETIKWIFAGDDVELPLRRR